MANTFICEESKCKDPTMSWDLTDSLVQEGLVFVLSKSNVFYLCVESSSCLIILVN